MSSAGAVLIAALIALGILLFDLPVRAWSTRTRYVVLAFMALSLTITMTTATDLWLNPGPLQIWPLVPWSESL